jgi:hypothetical protein
MSDDGLGRSYLDSVRVEFEALKRLAERAIAQVGDEQLAKTLDRESNSIAVIVRHLSGNMLSRWTDFLSSDGEKPWRDRDREFVDRAASRPQLLEEWEQGWACLFGALTTLAPADLVRTVVIRNEPHTVVQAINRQLAHYGQHVGQIVLLAKHLAGERWTSLSIPRGRSREWLEKPRPR